MASLQLRGSSWSCIFCFQGKRHWLTLGEVSEIEAHATGAKIDYLLMRIKQKLIDAPPGCDIVTFVQHDGKPPTTTDSERPLTLAKLEERYFDTHRSRSAASTIEGMELHFKHMKAYFGKDRA